jgi:hypothetical protein
MCGNSSCWTYLLPLILNQVSAHRLWARERSSLQEQPSTMPLPDSAAALSSPRWQMRQLLSAFVMSASPASRSTSSSEHSDTHDFLPRLRRRRRRTRTGRCSPPRRSLAASARTGHRRPRSTVSPPPRRSPPPLSAPLHVMHGAGDRRLLAFVHHRHQRNKPTKSAVQKTERGH